MPLNPGEIEQALSDAASGRLVDSSPVRDAAPNASVQQAEEKMREEAHKKAGTKKG
jgi:hypothetical protein